MTKIMLVEDDKSLREIYGVRLLAEGYDIVSAGDGEEALAMAIKERPSLIVTDIMMPRISGFDMLDILRSTTETKNIKVIMMTALSSEEHRQRGEAMGADRYLVKSQVGIEDVVRVVHEVLNDSTKTAQPAKQQPAAPTASARPTIAVPQRPNAQGHTPQAASSATPATSPPAQTQSAMPTPPAPTRRPTPPASAATAPPVPQASQTPHDMPPISSTTPSPPSVRQRIIQPINDNSTKVNINDLLDRELAREAGVSLGAPAPVATTQQEKDIVQSQLKTINSTPTAPASATANPPQTPMPPTPPTPPPVVPGRGSFQSSPVSPIPPAQPPQLPTQPPQAPPPQNGNPPAPQQ